MPSSWFAHPMLLWLTLALPVASLFSLYAFFRNRWLIAKLAKPLLLRKSLLVRSRARSWKGLLFTLGLSLLAIACAGPQWGLDPNAYGRKGRDVLIVLDLSRSMRAQQPDRRVLALRSLHNVADVFEDHGGNRVALVGFAAKARLFFPLTQDYDHLRKSLKMIEEDDYAPLTDENAASGTRIGAALQLAVKSCDPARLNRPIIVLVSDGDDPLDDGEWTRGADEAAAKQIRVHTVGVGNPEKSQSILVGDDVLQFEGEPIRTKLNEKLLADLARRTQGTYLPAHDREIELGTLVQHLLDVDELREETTGQGDLPVYQLRIVWFLFPAVLFFVLSMVLSDGPHAKQKEEKAKTHRRRPFASSRGKMVSAALVIVAILSISAADSPAVDALLRKGIDAFERKDYQAAIGYYEQVEALSQDPGLVSFNKAAAHYRLGNLREAIDGYRRALEDDAAPSMRKARAHFDLGNALMKNAGGAQELREAVENYRACLRQQDLPTKLQADARHNLEVAQLLWLRAKANEPDVKEPDLPPQKDPFEEKDPAKSAETYKPVDPDKKHEIKQAEDAPTGKSSKLQPGTLQVLRDKEDIQNLSREDALKTLDENARRIAQQRRAQRNPAGPANLSTKDW